MFKIKTFTIYLFLTVLFFLPLTVLAQGGYEIQDNHCWAKEDCIDAVGRLLNITGEKAQKSFYTGTDSVRACGHLNKETGKEFGFCSALGETQTTVYFNGKNIFTNIGDFIQFIYKYGVAVAAVLAVISIINAGFKITVGAAGGSEKIQEGKKQLGRSLMGLFLAVMSYVILYTINPYLVNFRVPQTWLLNPASYQVDFCKDLSTVNSDNFSLVGSANKPIDAATAIKLAKEKKIGDYEIRYDIQNKESKKIFSCGQQFIYTSNQGQICHGNFCPGSQLICIKNIAKSKEPYECLSGSLWGEVSNSELFDWTADWDETSDSVVNDFHLFAICTAGPSIGTMIEIPATPTNPVTGSVKTKFMYLLKADPGSINKAYNDCGGEANMGGYILYPDFDELGSFMGMGDLDWFDEAHYVGINPIDGSNIFDLGENIDPFINLIRMGGSIAGNQATEYLIPRDRLQGYRLDIDVANVHDADYFDWYKF